ncbi:hypothetical protein EVJ58_g8268 [Rhodofomes roseus]|uniref:MYND-type domain-containing protein n=1 Tax=Rhodofomes roseus TaxID=34475 RepID=A0A4Y9Y1F8_9APHY|nr:hypothetical protein EVJ58_g8268 [Rhodofomes roseus]
MSPSLSDASVLPKPGNTVCAACQKAAAPGETLKRCQNCRSAPYCSKECQVADWKKHKRICSVYMRDSALGFTTTNVNDDGSKGKKGRAARTRIEVLQDLAIWGQAHNGDTLTVACWQAMDLLNDFGKAETHFLVMTLRRNETWTSPRTMYKFVDAQILPVTLLSERCKPVPGAVRDGRPPNFIKGPDKLKHDFPAAIGCALVMAYELEPDEDMTVEEAFMKKNSPAYQPIPLWQEHKDKFSRYPSFFPSFWKLCLKNGMDGGGWSPIFEPWSLAQS